ncbi:MAG: glycosyltransferase, partial [Oscillospiraceae bacterium]
MENLKATVVIPNLNGAAWLKDSIESIYAQTEKSFELIVVDNGSTDQSLDIARSYQNRENYTLIENGKNTGFSFAVNQGISLAKAPFVLLFNNDAFAQPDLLAELLLTAGTDDKIFAVQACIISQYDRTQSDYAG